MRFADSGMCSRSSAVGGDQSRPLGTMSGREPGASLIIRVLPHALGVQIPVKIAHTAAQRHSQ
jgi:hypothetical protein